MNKAAQRRFNSATILATAALVVASASFLVNIGGFASASPGQVIVRKVVVHKGIVRRGDIAPGAVTAKSLARGAVTAGKIAKSAVISSKLAAGSVTTPALAPQAVTGVAIAPASIEGGMLAQESIVTKPIADLDTVVDKNWTPSNTEPALCGGNEALLGGGYAFTNPGNSEVGWLEALPVVNGATKGIMGRITSNSGGSATAEVAAICLK